MRNNSCQRQSRSFSLSMKANLMQSKTICVYVHAQKHLQNANITQHHHGTNGQEQTTEECRNSLKCPGEKNSPQHSIQCLRLLLNGLNPFLINEFIYFFRLRRYMHFILKSSCQELEKKDPGSLIFGQALKLVWSPTWLWMWHLDNVLGCNTREILTAGTLKHS